MAGGFLTGMAAKHGEGATLSATAQCPHIACLDWTIPGMCSFTCKHCHPDTGLKAAKVKKLYYCVYGDDISSPFIGTLSAQLATDMAVAIHKGQLHSGDRVEIFDKMLRVIDTANRAPYNAVIPPNTVRAYLTNSQLRPVPDGAHRIWFGEGFCGLGMIQYHDDCIPDQRDLAALQAGYSEEVMRGFLQDDIKNRS